MEEKALRAFFGWPSRLSHPEFGLIALERTNFYWIVISEKGQTILTRPKGAKIIGVMSDERSEPEPGLLALEDDFRTVTLNGHNWRKEVMEAHARVEHIAVCQRAPYIAYSTVDGEIVIHSLQHGADLCRYLQEGKK